MKLLEIIHEGCEEVYVDDDDNVIEEAAIRQWKRTDKGLTKKYRCLAGPKAGRLVTNPAGCATRKDPKKVRQGRKVMRSKKGIIGRKAKITKRTSMSKMLKKMNRRLSGKSV